MKRALVLTLLVFGLGAAVFAGPLSGSWTTSIKFDPQPTFAVTSFSSVLDVDYTVGAWTFGSTAIFTLDAFDNVFFTAQGTLGAFEFRSMLDFEPVPAAFMSWTNAGKLSIAGVDIFGLFVVDNVGTAAAPLIGTGATFGLSGSAGDVSITGTIQFNMYNYTYYFHNYGYAWAVARDAYQSCGVWYKPSGLPYGVQTESCTLSWSGVGILVDFPFTCLDVQMELSFSCENGFDSVAFYLTGFDLGISWLALEEIDITFTVDSKTVDLYWDVVLGDAVCVTPYITLEGDGASISGLTLNALLLSYSFNGVTFKAGEIFDNTWYTWALNGTMKTWGFTSTGGLSWSCIYNEAYDEFFGIVIDGDSCCGGAFNVGIYNFFDTSESTLFAWQETLASLSVGVGTNTSVQFGLSLMNDGVNWFTLGATFTW